LSSTVTGTGINGSNGGGGIEHTVATILAGSNSGSFTGSAAATPSMTWRTRLLNETPVDDGTANGSGFVNGSPTNPPSRLPLISDVVDLFGMSTASTSTNFAPVQTDPFAFQMSFNPKTLLLEGATNASMGTRGNVFLASLVSGSWVNAITSDFTVSGNTTTTTYNGATINIGIDTLASMPKGISRPYEGTFASWESTYDPGLATPLADFIGVWGVDADVDGNYEAWAIINHNSEFAVVPEPSTIVLAAIGLLGGIAILRRKKAARLEA
jgi:hypothetical protein